MALDLYTIAFVIFAVLAVLSSLFVFLSRKLVHAIIALTMAFSASAVIFIILGQSFVALLQLLVLVGGLSTYLVVSLASEEKNRKMLRTSLFIPVAAVLAVILSYFAYFSLASAQVSSTASMEVTFAASMSQYYPILYGVAALLFSAAIGSALFLKKFTKLVT